MTRQGGTPVSDGPGLAPPDALPAFVPSLVYQTAVAVLVLLVAYYLSKLVRRTLGRRVSRRFRRPSVTRTVLRAIQTCIVLLGSFVGLGILGIRLGDLTISLSVFSAVLGIVLAPLIGSLLSGVFVLTERPYEIGDMVHLTDRDTYGFIEDITLRYTKVFTLDNTFLVVPNGEMRDRDVVNFSAEDSRTRLSLDLLVTYESDIEEARRLVESAARGVDRVIEGGPDIRIGGARYPASPTCYIDAYADHGVNLRLRFWVTEPYKLLTARSAVQTNVREALADADVEFAYPHSHLVFDETSGELQVGTGDRPTDAPGRRVTERGRQPEPGEEGAGEGAPPTGTGGDS